jgi:flagellar FliJ protein
MSQHNRLKIILGFITKQEEAAAKNLSNSLQKRTNAQQQITQLQQYSREYMGDNLNKINIPQLQNRQNFLAKISSAVTQQESLLPELEKDIEDASQSWQKTKLQRKGIERIIQKHQVQQEKQEELQLQIDLDAYATRRKR